MRAQIYANYGCLAHEKMVVYTTAPEATATCSEALTVEIPAEIPTCLNYYDQVCVSLPDMPLVYPLDEVLGSYAGHPVLTWYDGRTTHRIVLDVVEDAE
jgi:hypothetical protein